MQQRILTVGLAVGAIIAASATAHAAPTPGDGPTPDDVIAGFVAERDGVTRAEAIRYLDRKQDRQRSYDRLTADGSATDGAYFAGESLVVIVEDTKAASAVRAAGLTARTGLGQRDLDRVVTSAAQAAGASGELVSLTPDLKGQRVVATVTSGAPSALVRALGAVPHVVVETGTELRTTADVVPGRIMDLSPGTNCSLGFPGTTSSGDNVLLTAGHCVERKPDILDGDGTKIGKGVASRFRTGLPSVDMGLMDIDAEDTGQPFVDSRGAVGNVPIRGASKNAVGTEICKAGNTTGWTCGVIEAYNVTVNYGGSGGTTTRTSGLAQSTVCTEGGDSGGAYIGANEQAQGMTSGGPVGSSCGFNSGSSQQNRSYYQPVVDAASYYGVTVLTQ
jgi:hypothetical protein